jgi:hypothetical protein
MKLRFILVMECGVSHLEHYNASTLEEAVINQQRWIDEGDFDILDIVLNSEIKLVKVEAVRDEK